MIKITDINDSNIQCFKSLKNKTLDNNKIIAESEKVILKLLMSKIQIYKLFTTKKSLNVLNPYLPANTDIFLAEQDLMKKIIGHNLHHGVFALAKKPEDFVLDDIEGNVVVLNGLTSPENVGSIIRSMAAFKVKYLIFGHKTVSPYTRRAIRVSMGNVFFIKTLQSNSLEQTTKDLKSKKYTIISTANLDRSININNYNFSEKNCLIIGSEGDGIDQNILNNSDITLKIPIDGNVQALNASNAVSIFLYKLTS